MMREKRWSKLGEEKIRLILSRAISLFIHWMRISVYGALILVSELEEEISKVKYKPYIVGKKVRTI